MTVNVFEKDTTRWKLLRTKSGTSADADYAGTNTAPDAADLDPAPIHRARDLGSPREIEFIILSCNGSNVPQDRGSCTFDMQLIEVFDRDSRAAGLSAGVADSAVSAGMSLNRKIRIQMNGAKSFGVRISNVASAPAAHDHFEVWYREVVS